MYPKLLAFDPVVRVSLDMSTFRDCICPVVVTKGADSVLRTRFELRDDPAVTKNYGELLVRLAQTVPDGVVCFYILFVYGKGR